MYNSADFLSMLQSGQDSSTIASELTKALNDAVAQKVEMDKKHTAQRKVNMMADMLDEVIDFLNAYYPKVGAMVDTLDIDTEELADVVVASLDKAYADMEKDFDALAHLMKIVDGAQTPAPTTTENKNSDPIADFLKQYHLS